MGRFNYLVYGAGRCGTAVIHDLIKNCDAAEVCVYDPSPEATLSAGETVGDLFTKEERARVYWENIIEDARFCKADVVVNCAPYSECLDVTLQARRFGVPYCDLGGNTAVVNDQAALEGGSPVVPDCGIAPGISNILAVGMAKEGYEGVDVRCGGLPRLTPTNVLKYKVLFSPAGLVSEYAGNTTIIRNGRIEEYPCASGVTPGCYNMGLETCPGGYEADFTSNNSPKVAEYLLSLGVTNYTYKTLRYRGHWEAVRGWRALGYLCGDVEKDKELVQRLTDNPDLQMSPDEQDMLVLRVHGTHEVGCVRSTSKEVNLNFWHDGTFTAMANSTAWGITLVAHWLALHPNTVSGFAPPETFVPMDWVLEGLEKRMKTP